MTHPPAATDRLLVFTRVPAPGTTKTRLAGVLGAAGAADLQRRLTARMLDQAQRATLRHPLAVQVRYTGGTPQAVRQWLGPRFDCRPQGGGDLGARMARGLADALDGACRSAGVVGSDIPGVTADLLVDAFTALSGCDVVLGPARDGGYWFIGVRATVSRRHRQALFAEIPWGTDAVCTLTCRRAADLGLRVHRLACLADIDRPADLAAWPAHADPVPPLFVPERIAVIVPALDEACRIAACVRTACREPGSECIVVDGGSRDATRRKAAAAGARVIRAPAGRARQMNAGAALATGGILVFLHADTRLPAGYGEAVRTCLGAAGTVAGAFALRIDAPGRALRLVERMIGLRSRLLGLPYGDQALFLTAERFHDLGGYAPLPILEDYLLVRALGRQGRIRLVSRPVVTSARRWRRLGLARTTLINQLIIAGYHAGVAPAVLAGWYRGKE